jgi:tetratricopeptide (TPR) repeat protein
MCLILVPFSLGPHHPNVAIDLNNLAQLLKVTKRFEEAEPLYWRALAICENALGSEHPDTARILSNLADLCTTQGRYAQAEPFHRRAVVIVEKSLGQNDPHVAACLNNLALLFQATDRLEEAEPLSRRQLEILFQFSVLNGHAQPHLHEGVTNYAALLKQMGRTPAEVLAQLNDIARPYGMHLNPAGSTE